MNPVQVNGAVDKSTATAPSPSLVNSFRISAVVDRLLPYVFCSAPRNDNNEISHLCLSLARGIDMAVSNNERPANAVCLPSLLKQVCQWRNDVPLQAAITVLMFSIKGACKNGWFNEKDIEELYKLSDEMASTFCSVRDVNFVESTLHHNISTVMSRFYPTMKMHEILTFVEATQGYGAFVKDFRITKGAKSSNRTYLFVAQTNNTETSSCIISPQLVNFLLNGEAVDRRTCVHMDSGPQTPTEVTQMVHCGTNLLQALGQFDGSYIIVVAFMSMIASPSWPALIDYLPQAAAAPDNDVIEGPSRISLNCPISFKRIKTPVKGQLCKHLQCFDFGNYVDINSRIPSWRCPHCSQSVCFTDVRIDRSMVKVLKEVGSSVSYVKISADGSWEAVNEGDVMEKQPLHQQNMTPQDKGADILDLTEGDDDVNAVSQGQSHASSSNDAKFQQFNSNNTSNGYGRYPAPATHATRIPITVQGFPAQASAGMVGDRQQQTSRMNLTPQQIMYLISAQQSQHTASQNWVQQIGGHSGPPPQSSGYLRTSAYLSNHFSAHQQQPINQMISNPAQLSPQVHQGVVGLTTSLTSIQQAYQSHMAAVQVQQANHARSWRPSVQAPVQTSVSSMPVASSEEQRDVAGRSQSPQVAEGSDEQNWRPSGRMRGSLSGRAYADALNQYMILPTQPVQAARPPVLNTPRPVISSHLQALIANYRNAHGLQDGNGGGS